MTTNENILVVKCALKMEGTCLMSQKFKNTIHRGLNKNPKTKVLNKKIIKLQVWKHLHKD